MRTGFLSRSVCVSTVYHNAPISTIRCHGDTVSPHTMRIGNFVASLVDRNSLSDAAFLADEEDL